MRPILDRLVLSSLAEANDPFFLKQHGIQAIMYFGEGGMFSDDLKLYHRPANSDGTISPEMLRDGIEFLRESLRAGRRVLAVGASGATILTAYLAEMGFSSAQALQLVGRGHGGMEPEPDRSSVESHAEELERRKSSTLNHMI